MSDEFLDILSVPLSHVRVQIPASMTPAELREIGMAHAKDETIDRQAVAALFNLSDSDFESIMANDIRLEQALERGHKAGALALKRRQVDMAIKGDKSMLTHLGKHMLGQDDKLTLKGDPDAPLDLSLTVKFI